MKSKRISCKPFKRVKTPFVVEPHTCIMALGDENMSALDKSLKAIKKVVAAHVLWSIADKIVNQKTKTLDANLTPKSVLNRYELFKRVAETITSYASFRT